MTEGVVSAPNQKVRDRETALFEKIDALLAEYATTTLPATHSPDDDVSCT